MIEIKQIIRDLINKLNNWSKEYYVDSKPSVSDQQYDAIYNQLKKMELEYPNFIFSDSPTQRVGHYVDNRFQKIKHQFPMLSLGNAYNNDDLIHFDNQIKKQLNLNEDIEYICEYKIDGLSISLLYENGALIKALTRGDGFLGEDVTHNVLVIDDIPKIIDDKRKIEFRGEIYMKKSVFNTLNKNGEKLANPRNAASGSIRQLDSSIVKKRNLSCFIYAIPNALELGLKTHKEVLNFIAKMKFTLNEKFTINSSVNEVLKSIEEMTLKRFEMDFDVDGVVVKVNNMFLWEDIGYTVKAPKYMIAYKFPEEIGQSELEEIFPTIGRTGRVTYNARIKPLLLGGSIVTAATLHNADYVHEININVGDIVNVKKAAEIIPKVLGVYKKNNNALWKEWGHCPACKHPLVRSENEVDQYCINEDCPQKNIALLEHFVSRKAMDIEHLSIQTIKLFLEQNLISDIPSIFQLPLKKDQILLLPGFKEKSISNIINAIEKAKKQDLGKFIFALGIRHVGEKLSNILAKRFGSLERIIAASKEEIESIRDFGTKVANSIVKYFSDQANIEMLNKLINFGINFYELKGPNSNKLSNLTFVITGTLSKSRDYFKDLIEKNGGNVASAVSKNTSYLLAGTESGNKLIKANELRVKIINENDFLKMVEEK